MKEAEKIRVIIADDHAIMREGLCSLLESEPDIEISAEAVDGQDALEKAQALLPDVVVMDIDMPRMTGLEATRAIKKEHPEIGILVLTAHEDDEYIFNLLKAGATGYLLKRSSGYNLGSAIRTIKNGEFSLAPQIAAKLVNNYLQPAPQGGERVDDDFIQSLTDFEVQVMKLMIEGLTPKDISQKLASDIKTIEGERTHIFRKLDIHEREERVDSESLNKMKKAVERYEQSTVDFLASEAPQFSEKFRETQSPDGVVTIMFTDLQGFTDLTERIGDQAAHDLLGKCNSSIRKVISGSQGYEVKTIGDAFMVAFRSARNAVQCALSVQQALKELNASCGSDRQLSVRIGLNTGEPIKQGNDFFGSGVNLAARIERKARGGEILVSDLVFRLTGKIEGAAFVHRGSFVPKGFSEECQIYEVVPEETAG
jgi:two-component system response regulator NreC